LKETDFLLEKINKLRVFLESEADKRDKCFNDYDLYAISVKLDELMADYTKRLLKDMNIVKDKLETSINF
jgi:hypothetical protein